MNRKNKIVTLAMALLLLVGAVGGTLAYLTDSEVTRNTFTIGDVTIESLEPNYPGNDDPTTDDLEPNEEVKKDPLIDNNGINDAIVMMTVDSPMGYITVVGDDGAVVTEKGMNELFWFKDEADGVSVHANNFDAKWIELTDKEMYVLIKADGTESKVEAADLKTAFDGKAVEDRLVKRYVFGYSELIHGVNQSDGTAQTPENKKTTPLFDKLQLKNVIEGEIDGSTQHVDIRSFGIQPTAILEDGRDLTAELNKENLTKIFDVFVAQNSTDNDTSGLKITDMRDADDLTQTTDGASGTYNKHYNRWDTEDDVTGEGNNLKP